MSVLVAGMQVSLSGGQNRYVHWLEQLALTPEWAYEFTSANNLYICWLSH